MKLNLSPNSSLILGWLICLSLACNRKEFDPTICPDGCPPNMVCNQGICECEEDYRTIWNTCWGPKAGRFIYEGDSVSDLLFNTLILDSFEYRPSIDRYEYNYYRNSIPANPYHSHLRTHGSTWTMKRTEGGYRDSLILTDVFYAFRYQDEPCSEYLVGVSYGQDSMDLQIIYRNYYTNVPLDTSRSFRLRRWRP